ncbi:hypothetical protein Phep_1762 [Pedobacter heparinus DSM 2366]|uniref:Uncharacterized protein n=1 Tax=Pedobacter heparinus (strain ATCC 13125 / DSM 2366 / CIP 104194 / JCM 7457 / NBRC 12017 / NCIMB 9290 / NRRL B-14731 / HIM 762-3) TaxID=485917 RepID=C6XVA5_PEDHD|nr:hypothetical protein Phep_1762 [Pedobacter heparinus DSM 2366]
MGIDIIIITIVVLGMTIWFIDQTRRKTKYGINLRTVYCPVCKTKQPRFRKPLNDRQKMYGGGTCSNCKTEMDKYGDVIS